MAIKPPGALEPHRTESQNPGVHETERHSPELPRFDLEDDTPSRSYWWVWLLIFAAIGYGCYKLYQYENSKKAAITAKKGSMRPRSTAVVAATARQGDMPVYLQGLGTVTAFNTVTVKTRVDGQLTSVGFKEGQFV